MSDLETMREEFDRHAIRTVPESEEKIRLRSAEWIRHRNEGKLQEFVDTFTPQAIFYDADGRTIKGKPKIMDYSAVLFEYGEERGGHPFVVVSSEIFADSSNSSVFYEKGVYNWTNIENGRYINKWTWKNDNFYLDHAYFKIDDMTPMPPVPLIDGNVPNGHNE